jgi:hypothetical protein
MKKTTAILFLLAFAGLSFYYFFAEDYCPVHNLIPSPAFSHTHRQPPSICLCFWNTLFAPGSYDFSLFHDMEPLTTHLPILDPAKPFNSDIAHPPKSLPA